MRLNKGFVVFALVVLAPSFLSAEKITSSEVAPLVISEGERGGKKIRIDEHHFEVVFQKDGVMVYANDDASEAIEAKKVRGFIKTTKGLINLNFERKDKSVFFAPNVYVTDAEFLAIDVLFTDGHGVGGRLPLDKKTLGF